MVSLPSWDIFEAQPQSYRDEILPPAVTKRLAVEAGITMGWERYIGDQGKFIGVNRFGASAPAKKIAESFGLTVDNVYQTAKSLL